MSIPDYVLAAALREFPCVCEDDYTLREKVAPHCRHDDMRHALEAAWGALHPPVCCVCCREEWETQVAADGAPFSVVVARRMYVCPRCGDKRCPKAEDHRAACRTS